MKTIRYVAFFVAILTTIILSSCGKNNDNSSLPLPDESKVTLK